MRMDKIHGDGMSATDIAAMLGDRIEELCRELLPNGRRVGNEWHVGSIHGESGDSLRVCLSGPKKGLWADFADDQHRGDSLDLVKAHQNLDTPEALKWGRDRLGLSNVAVVSFPTQMVQPATADEFLYVSPIPKTAGKAPNPTGLGEHSAQWAYRNADGEIVALVRRYERPGGGKEFRPLTFWRRTDELGLAEWKFKSPPGPRPLYGLDRLAKMPGAFVHLCEGEKAAKAAQDLFPEEACTSWMGGSQAVGKADWSPLAGRTALVWPDNDNPGRKAAEAVASSCIHAGAHEVRIVDIPTGWPEKWDLADPLPDGVTRDDLDRLRRDARPIAANSTPASHGDGWPSPDLSVLQEGRRSPPTFSFDPYGAFWGDWIGRMAELKNAPPDYVAGTLTGVSSSLIGNARWVSPWPGWTEPSTIWECNVGISSSGKSPGQEAVLDLVNILQQELLPGYDAEKQKWEGEKEAARIALENWKEEIKDAVKNNVPPPTKPDNANEPEQPHRPRLFVSDTTPESLGPKLAAQPKGLMVVRDELSGWLHGMDRYSGGSAERSMWLEAFGGRAYTIDRVKYGSEPIVIQHLAIPIVGGMVPENVSKVMGGLTDDGLASRFLFVWPQPSGPMRPTAQCDNASALAALRRLHGLQMGTDDKWNSVPIVVRLTEDAADLFQQWRETNHQEELTAHGLYLTHLGKLPGITLRLALLLEHLWWSASEDTAPPEHVTIGALAKAADLVDEYHKPMARRVCGDAAVPEAERAAAAIARRIVLEGTSVINASEIRRGWKLPSLRDADSVKKALGVLEEANCIRPQPSRSGSTTGRQKTDYEVNPVLLETV